MSITYSMRIIYQVYFLKKVCHLNSSSWQLHMRGGGDMAKAVE